MLMLAAFAFSHAGAQQYKIRQATIMSGMQSESTIYVKGMRKRTEGGGFMGMTNPATIEQCDLQRTIRINDKKKLYYIEPFASETEETMEEVAKPVAKNKPLQASAKEKSNSNDGGTIYMWYNITDTGERKKMYGFTARHVWTTQKMNPSADACMMKDSMLIKTDGWYIDLPQFDCPLTGHGRTSYNGGQNMPACRDRFVSKRTGKGKLGFPLIETKTMIMSSRQGGASEFVTTIETLELSVAKLDSMLFEIPPGYTETKNEEDLQDKFDVSSMMKQGSYNNKGDEKPGSKNTGKLAGSKVAVLEPVEETGQLAELHDELVDMLNKNGVEAVAVSSAEEAKDQDCGLLLTVTFSKFKQAGKVGSLIKAIKNADPGAATSFTLEGAMVLKNVQNGAVRQQQKIIGKYDGKASDAAMQAMTKGWGQLLDALE